MIKIWLDDLRVPPNSSWTWCKEVEEAVVLIADNDIYQISFDHDLGEDTPTGYELATWIEERVVKLKKPPPIHWNVHSANPIGAKNIEAAMTSANRLWNSICQQKRMAENQ